MPAEQVPKGTTLHFLDSRGSQWDTQTTRVGGGRRLVVIGLLGAVAAAVVVSGAYVLTAENATEASAEPAPDYERRNPGFDNPIDRQLREMNPLQYASKFYPGATRDQLEWLDPDLCGRLRAAGDWDVIPFGPDFRGGDALKHYLKYYPGYNQWQLLDTDPLLVKELQKQGYWDKIPL